MVQRKRQSRKSDSDENETENANKILKIDLNYWIYLKSEEQNLAKYALKHPKNVRSRIQNSY